MNSGRTPSALLTISPTLHEPRAAGNSLTCSMPYARSRPGPLPVESNRIESRRTFRRYCTLVRLLAHVDSTTVYMYIWSVAMGIIFKTGMSI